MRKKVMIVYGTRPEAIKIAPIVLAMRQHPVMQAVIVSTGQHREMLDQVNQVFSITPDYELDAFSQGQPLHELSAKIFSRLGALLEQTKPDAVLIQGDTTTVAIGALAAFYQQIPVIHLEAGLRSGNIMSPFPEEANRRITTQVAALHLAPTTTSRDNLIREGINPRTITVTGNTVIDALYHTVNTPVGFTDERLEQIMKDTNPVLLVTCHRRENWGQAMEEIGLALRDIAQKLPQYTLVFPAHGNPLVRQTIVPHIIDEPNVYVCDPLAYAQFTHLLNRAHIVLTDSGGIQEEAPSLGKPVLVMRENTERPEGVEAGTVRLVGTDRAWILGEVTRLATDPGAYAQMAQATNPYGDGKAAEKSLLAIRELLGV